jgi:hypothetical protein
MNKTQFSADPTSKKLNELVEKSGKSLDEVGVAMGYPRRSLAKAFGNSSKKRRTRGSACCESLPVLATFQSKR